MANMTLGSESELAAAAGAGVAVGAEVGAGGMFVTVAGWMMNTNGAVPDRTSEGQGESVLHMHAL